MWICPNCAATNPPESNDCPHCGFAQPAAGQVAQRPARVAYKLFRGTFASWESLFSDTAEFATALGRERLISISHSEDNDEGVVTVWYWK
jgi:hypothetical protein